MSDRDEHRDREDAQIATFARRRPGAFARWLLGLNDDERREAARRVGRGLTWLGRNEREGADNGQ